MRRWQVERVGFGLFRAEWLAIGMITAVAWSGPAPTMAQTLPAEPPPASQPAATQPIASQPATQPPVATQPAQTHPAQSQPATTQAAQNPAIDKRVVNGAIADPRTYLAKVVDLLETPWPKNRAVTIVCHGHSVPAGYFKTPDVQTFNAYPHLFHRLLKDKNPYAVVNVIVTAIGGEQSEQGAARFERDVLSLRPDVVTIDYALNDRAIGLDRAWVAWSAMIEKAQAAGVKVILMTPTPDTRAKLDSPDDPLLQHAEQIRQLARKYHVGLVDSLIAFRRRVEAGAKLENLMSQPNHPNKNGHETVAKELIMWFPASGTRG